MNAKRIAESKANILSDQLAASFVLQNLENKKEELAQRLLEIADNAAQKTTLSNQALSDALECIESVRDFVSPGNLSHVLGSEVTKHGEIAEHVEVEISNGFNILKHLKPIADLNVGRTAPEDYIIDNTPVQSKFIAGFNKTLDHVLEHIHKYPDFAKDATAYGYPGKSGFYHIPKDQYEIIKKILDGETTEFSQKTINKCVKLVEEIENNTGKSFIEVVKPSISNYSEVQLGTIDKTLDSYEQQYHGIHEDEIKEIRKEKIEDVAEAKHITDASWGDAAKAGATAAVIGATISGGLKLYSKTKGEGRNITQLTSEDWKEIGYDFTKGGVRGGISGVSIYALTKLGGFSAPFAGSIVTTGLGTTSLILDYKKGLISKNEYCQSACVLSVEAGMAAVGTAIGQTLIPIPVVGAIVGTMAAKTAIEITKFIVDGKEKELIKMMQDEYDNLLVRLNDEARCVIEKIDYYFNKLNGLIDASMNRDSNIRLISSINICRCLGVDESQIIHNTRELDSYILS